MTAAVALLAVLLGWSVRRFRPRGRARGSSRRPDASWVEAGLAQRWRRWRVHLFGTAAPPDAAPLLRFRTAIERGASVAQAFESVASGTDRWATSTRRLVRRVRAGAGIQAATDAWVVEEPDPSARLLADALAISTATGGSHLRAVDAVIDAVRDRAALQREVRALASQAQTSALVLVCLPQAFAVVVAAVDPRVRAFYLGWPLGPLCVAAGSVLDLLGAALMVRLVRSVA